MLYNARVVKVKDKTCDIKPYLKTVQGDFPIIENVPIATSTHSVSIKEPLKVGDDVTVGFVKNAKAAGVHFTEQNDKNNYGDSVILGRFVDSIPKTDATIEYDGNLTIKAQSIKFEVSENNFFEITKTGGRWVSNGIEVLSVVDETALALTLAQIITVNGLASFTNLAQFTTLQNTKTSVMKKT